MKQFELISKINYLARIILIFHIITLIKSGDLTRFGKGIWGFRQLFKRNQSTIKQILLILLNRNRRAGQYTNQAY